MKLSLYSISNGLCLLYTQVILKRVLEGVPKCLQNHQVQFFGIIFALNTFYYFLENWQLMYSIYASPLLDLIIHLIRSFSTNNDGSKVTLTVFFPIHLSVWPSIYVSHIYASSLSVSHSLNHPLVHPSIYRLVHPFSCPYSCTTFSSSNLPIHPCVHPFFVHPSIPLFLLLFKQEH